MGDGFDPKGKGYLLGTHILEKGFQAGSLIGVLVVGPLAAYRAARRGEGDVVRRAVKACGTSAVVGSVLAGTAWPHGDMSAALWNQDRLLYTFIHEMAILACLL